MSGVNEDFVLLNRDDVSDYNEANILPESPASQEQLIAWLKPTAYDAEGSEYQKHLAAHLPGTGAWLTSKEAYADWHDSADNGLVWIKGIPGSGKSVFAATLAKKLAEEGRPVLFFFFRQIIDANHEPVALLRDWLCQILPFSPPLQAKLNTYVKAKKSVEGLSMDHLWKDLRLALSHQPQVYVIADALDEMDSGHDDFLSALASLGSWRPSRVKVIITSRPVNTVEIPLRNAPALHIRLEERLVDIDIATYVNHRLHGTAIVDSDRRSIREAVPGRANGLFLYAKLAMDAFLEVGADIQEVLQDLPLDLNVMYTDLLREHARRSGVSHEVQLHILQWVTHASRPLRLLELAEMINVTSEDGTNRNLKAAKALVRSTCGPLIEILPDETVSVVHHSLTEFLKGSTRLHLADAKGHSYPTLGAGSTHARLALSCVQYLQCGYLKNLELTPRSDRDDFFRRKNSRHSSLKAKAPFIAYASENWHMHAVKAVQCAAPASKLNEIFAKLDLFLQSGHQLDAWVDVGNVSLGSNNVTPLHVAAWTGLIEYASVLLRRPDIDIDAVDIEENTPLHYAASEGHPKVVQVLLDQGAKPDVDNEIGLKPLHQAASRNRAEVVKLLLEAGVDPLTPKTRETGEIRCGNAPRSIGHTALMYACQNGHSEVVAEFLPFLNLETTHQALAWATSSGSSRVVSRILQQPDVNVNSLYRGDSPLFFACKLLDRQTVGILLEAGADPNQQCQNTDDVFGGISCYSIPYGDYDSEALQPAYTPMHAFAGLNRRPSDRSSLDASGDIFSLLLAKGANINQIDRTGNTPLHYAASRERNFSHDGENVALVQLFLDAGAEADVPSKSGETPLHCSMNDRSGETTRLLIEKGKANINRKCTSSGRTPLLYALDTSSVENPLRFLQYAPDCTITDSEGNGPLHVVMKSYSSNFRKDGPNTNDLIEALLAAGVDPNLRNNKGQTAMHVYHDSNASFFQTLHKGGASLEARDNDGRTVLNCIVSGRSRKNKQDLEQLLELGAQIDCRDFKGRTLLHEAVNLEDLDMFRLLLSKGVPYGVDYSGNTVLHELANPSTQHSGHRSKGAELLSRIKEIVESGAGPNQPNNLGCTPLHFVSASTPDSMHIGPGRVQPIDVWIKVGTKVDVADHNGVTPLHVASATCHYRVGRLLEAGATVGVRTTDGLTPIIVAARCRQSNIVGMLLQHLHGTDERLHAVQAKDKSGQTALHYACRSGRYETVAILIDAGAEIDARDNSGVTPLGACAEFQEEQELWDRFGYREFWSQAVLTRRLCNGGQEKSPNLRSRRQHLSGSYPVEIEQDTTKLEEIIDLLVSKGADPFAKVGFWRASGLEQWIHKSASNGYDYTATCFMHLKDKVEGGAVNPASLSFAQSCVMHRNAAIGRALTESRALKLGEPNEHLFRELLVMRRFDLIEDMVLAGVDFVRPGYRGETNLHLLANWGYSRLLTNVGSHEAALKLEDRDFCDHWETHSNCQAGAIKPLLIAACQRELPNMEVVKVLVEEHKVNIDAQHFVQIYGDRDHERMYGESALHRVASGLQWWHVFQALPYLIKAGANLELRNEDGCTPLHLALGASKNAPGYFHNESARVLIDSGANVNAVDDKGQSCLAKASGDCDLIELLIHHGADVSASAVFAAIDSRNHDILRALLSQGADPNQRRPKADADEEDEGEADSHLPVKLKKRRAMKRAKQRMLFDDGIDSHEWYPLHYAAVHAKESGTRGLKDAQIKGERKRSEQLIRELLDRGADPYRTFSQREWANNQNGEPTDRLIEATILHEIVAGSDVIQPFLDHCTFDPDRKDGKGRTLFLAACASILGPDASVDAVKAYQEPCNTGAPSIAEILLNRGADICAKDHDDWNALHVMLDKNAHHWRLREKTISLVISKAPHLVNEKNNRGESPLHHALRLGRCSLIEKLLDAGANPHLPDIDGNTALFHLSGKLPAKETCRILFQRFLSAGLSINTRNNLGETPLFTFIQACPHGDKSFYNDEEQEEESYKTYLHVFTDAGASIFDSDGTGQTLLHVVAAKRHSDTYNHIHGDKTGRVVELFKYLMELGLDPMGEDHQQRTALDIAAACGNDRILKLFERTGS